MLNEGATLIKCHDSYDWDSKQWIILEKMGSDIQKLIALFKENELPVSENLIKFVLYRTLQGLHFLHERKIIHRDIKSDNILYDMEGQVKLGDFGFAVQLSKKEAKKRDTMGTLEYMAPELVKEEEYDMTVDIWSFGIMCVEMANEGALPYEELEGPEDILKRLAKDKGPPKLQGEKWSPQFKDFVTKCLVVDPKKRWTAKQLLVHEFL